MRPAYVDSTTIYHRLLLAVALLISIHWSDGSAPRTAVAGPADSVERMEFRFDTAALGRMDLTILSRGSRETNEIALSPSFDICGAAEFSDALQGESEVYELTGCGSLTISGPGVYDLLSPIKLTTWRTVDGDVRVSLPDRQDSEFDSFELVSGVLNVDPDTGRLEFTADVALSDRAFATTAGSSTATTAATATGIVIGTIVVTATVEAGNRDDFRLGVARASTDLADGGAVAGLENTVGPDLIAEGVEDTKRWGRVGNITGYSIRMRTCNIGDERVEWVRDTNRHPVIAQNLYRLKDDRFEQIGMSWVKHVFGAIPDMMAGCVPGTQCIDVDTSLGSWLGSNCTDVYSADVNGRQQNMGPRFEINPVTGAFPWPFSTRDETGNSIYKRIQVHDNDIDPDLNPGALYFAEAHYVVPGEYPFGNQHNNASYAPVTVAENPEFVYELLGPPGGSTITDAAIFAWAANDPSVVVETADIPGDGRVFVASKVTDVGGGTWHYEYAVQNLNSDRAIGAFSVPVFDEMSVTNIAFHDVDSHSDSPMDSTDWPSTRSSCSLTWFTSPYESNQFANALRWGTLYNFRFDADTDSVPGHVTLKMFKPGGPKGISIPANVPDVGVTVLTALESFPPNDAIDARQPTDLDGNNPQGWQSIELTFDGCANRLNLQDVTLNQTGGLLPPPTISTHCALDDNSTEFFFDRRIEVEAWTSLTHTPSGTTWRIGYLPADVNADGTSAPADILAIIDSLNGVTLRPIWSTDVDRSLEAGPPDILRVIDLLNGAADFDPYLDRQLPE